MKSTLLSLAAIAATSVSAYAVSPKEVPDTFLIPERAVVMSGNPDHASNLVAILYSARDLNFQDPRAPRFMFLDRKGEVALGIGGYIKGTTSYDFHGAIDDGPNFTTYQIPVPANPAMRNRFNADASHSTIFLQLVGKNSRFGYYQVYVQTNFTGGSYGSYGLKLKQAYLSISNVKIGLARSTFEDGEAGLPTVDDQGPSGQIAAKNMLVQYAPYLTDDIRLAVSLEMPKASYTTGDHAEAINQRAPDVPVYLQYNYAGDSHVRLSAILRNLSYRDLVAAKNRFVTGWGVQLSGVTHIAGPLSMYYQGAYGKGIAQYCNDLSGFGFDLIPASTPGKLKAPGTLALIGGLQFTVNDRLFISGGYSQMRLYDQERLGGATYRYGQYVVASAFWTIAPEVQLGLEYLHGQRSDVDHQHNTANRIEAMLQYSF